MPAYLPVVTKFDPKGLKAGETAIKKFGKVAAATAAAAAAAVAGVAAAGIKEFAKFDAALNQSTSIMGDVSDALRDDMAQTAREVAKSTTFSAEQAAESFFFLASAGLDAEASIAAMPQVAKFAQAGMFDMALATDLLTDAQSALGLTVRDDAIGNLENMARVADTLVRANTLANASVEQFSTALTTKAGAASRALGKDVEETVAVLAAFADQGIKGELAGTQLSIVLRDLTTKAIKNKDEFEALGLSVFDSNGEMRNMGDIIANIESVLGGMSDETQKATLLQAGFSDKSLGALQALLGTSDAIKAYEAELRNAAGTTDDIANKQLDTMSAQFELLKSRVADVGIEIGSALAPAFLTLMDEMGPIIDDAGPALTDFFKSLEPIIRTALEALPGIVKGATDVIQGMTEATTALYDASLLAWGWIKDNIPTVATFVGVLGTLSTIIFTVTNYTKLLAVAQAALAVVMAVNPFYLIAAAVAAVAAGIVYLATKTTFFQDTWAAVTGFFTDAYNKHVKPIIEAFKTGIDTLYNNVIKPVFEAAMLILGLWAGTWVLVWESIISPILGLIGKALGHLFDFAKMIFESVAAEFKKLGQFFSDVFQMVITPVAEGIQTAFEHLGYFIEDVNNNIIKPVFKAFGEAFEWVYQNIITPVAEGIQDVFETVADAVGVAFEAMSDVMETIFSALKDIVKVPLNAIIGYVNGVIDAINSIRITIPTFVPVFGGQSFSPNLRNIPQLADGGIVMPRRGGVLANLAEAGKPEAVIPLDRLGSMGKTYNITVNAGLGTDGKSVGSQIVEEIIRYERASGRVFARA